MFVHLCEFTQQSAAVVDFDEQLQRVRAGTSDQFDLGGGTPEPSLNDAELELLNEPTAAVPGVRVILAVGGV